MNGLTDFLATRHAERTRREKLTPHGVSAASALHQVAARMNAVVCLAKVVFLAGMLVIFGCSDGALRLRHVAPPRRPPPTPSDVTENASTHRAVPGAHTKLRVATFNAGLAVGILPHAVERAEQVARALASLDVDVLCAQELWMDAHFRSVAAATRSRFAHALRPKPEPEAAALACTRKEVAPAGTCIRQSCDGVTPGTEQAAACAVRNCAHLAWHVSRECLSCLTRDPLRTLDEIEAACVDGRDGARPSSAASTRPTFGTSYGIGLFSRERVLAHDLLTLESEHHPRGVLYARLATAALGEAHVFCTHLTPVLGHVPHPRGRSWTDHQSRQVDRLLAFVEQKVPANGLVLVLGDLNTGPAAGRHVAAQLPAHYQRFDRRGFRNAYLDVEAPPCTYCAANPVAGGRGLGGSIIDHVLVRGGSVRVRAHRIFDDAVSVVANGKRVTTALSDHYGVFAEVEAAE